ncbi:MAG: hypothetical protein JWR38_1107 [Mucilaginibacter sp.]|nr:hypothetical protein [Mucilaginibacter sp.]
MHFDKLLALLCDYNIITLVNKYYNTGTIMDKAVIIKWVSIAFICGLLLGAIIFLKVVPSK